jgi:Tat protein secretion system quality control protein TatD with DNase activity
VLATLEALAQVRGISPSLAAEATTANALRLFNLNLTGPSKKES